MLHNTKNRNTYSVEEILPISGKTAAQLSQAELALISPSITRPRGQNSSETAGN